MATGSSGSGEGEGDPRPDDLSTLTDGEIQLRLYESLRRLEPLLTRLFEGGWLQDLDELGAWVKQVGDWEAQVGAWAKQIQAGQAELRAKLQQAQVQQDRRLQALLAELRRLRAEELLEDAVAALDDDAPPREAPNA